MYDWSNSGYRETVGWISTVPSHWVSQRCLSNHDSMLVISSDESLADNNNGIPII